MEQRDFIKDELERLGKALSNLMAKFLGWSADGNTSLGIEKTNEQLKLQLDIDVELILQLSQEELSEYLRKRKLTNSHIETLIDYFIEMGGHTIKTNVSFGVSILKKVLEMYQTIDETSKTYSFDRKEKEKKVNELLELNNIVWQKK